VNEMLKEGGWIFVRCYDRRINIVEMMDIMRLVGAIMCQTVMEIIIIRQLNQY